MSEPSSSESTLTLTTPIQYLPGVGPARATKLRKLGLRIARDILFLFPRNHTFPPPPYQGRGFYPKANRRPSSARSRTLS
ncbi:hypothetical protein [Rhodopirellula europaea]|uniref:hypothetical protein n=1 Tax=Rhodopirellula europaea TaxID=1263866 RepID=UPI003D2A0E61